MSDQVQVQLPDTTVESKNTTVIAQNDTTVLDLREKNFDKKLLCAMYLIIMACLLGYLKFFTNASDMILGFFITQLGAIMGALGNIITGKVQDTRAAATRATDAPSAESVKH